MTTRAPLPDNARGGHVPVMLVEVMNALSPRNGGIYVDGTFGAGGYTRAILDSCDCTVWAIDRDPDAIARANDLANSYRGRLHPIQGRFGAMDRLLGEHGITMVDGVALDLGVSSQQIDQPERGFSFRADGPLDMRMEKTGLSAADVINTADEATLADIFYIYGEERRSRAVARAIVRARTEKTISRTSELVSIIHRAIGPRTGEVDSATRTFQALRIHINDEMGEIESGLKAAERLLAPDGRLVVVSFHSLEDRTVKSFFSLRAGSSARPSRHQPSLSSRGTARAAAPPFSLLTRKTVRPSAAECDANPRAAVRRSFQFSRRERTHVSWRATVFWSLLAALVGFGLFHVKYQVQKLEDRLAKINRDMVREQEQIHVLRAEWTYLDRPERIEQLAKKYLDLAAPKVSQMSSIAQLPMRDAPLDPASAQSSRQPSPKAPPAPARSPQPAPGAMVPTPVAAGQTKERYQSRPSRPDFAAELSSGLDQPVTLPEGGR